MMMVEFIFPPNPIGRFYHRFSATEQTSFAKGLEIRSSASTNKTHSYLAFLIAKVCCLTPVAIHAVLYHTCTQTFSNLFGFICAEIVNN